LGDGGPASAALLRSPSGIALDPAGNIFIADTQNHRIRKIDAITHIITTVAGNGTRGFLDGANAQSSELDSPWGVFIDSAGNLLIADTGNHRIRKVDASNAITTIAGTGTPGFSGDGGPATAAMLNMPKDL